VREAEAALRDMQLDNQTLLGRLAEVSREREALLSRQQHADQQLRDQRSHQDQVSAELQRIKAALEERAKE